MRILTEVWKRKNKKTGKMEYFGAYNYYYSSSTSSEAAMITKTTYNNFKKGIGTLISDIYYDK